MDIMTRIFSAIDQKIAMASPTQLEPYSDGYDGFTHSTYSGLAQDVYEHLEHEGHESPSNQVIFEIVDELF